MMCTKISEKVQEVVEELVQLGDEAQYHYFGSGVKLEEIATIEDIEQLLKHRSPYIRAAALIGLRGKEEPEALDLIEKALEDEDLTIRGAAIVALGAAKGERAVELLIRIAEDEHLALFMTMQDAFSEFEGRNPELCEGLEDRLIGMLDDAGDMVVYVLSAIGGRKTINALRALRRRDPKRASFINGVLGDMAGVRAIG